MKWFVLVLLGLMVVTLSKWKFDIVELEVSASNLLVITKKRLTHHRLDFLPRFIDYSDDFFL